MINTIKNKKFNDVPLVFLTALISSNKKIKGLQEGAVDYIYKFFIIVEFENKIYCHMYDTRIFKFIKKFLFC